MRIGRGDVEEYLIATASICRISISDLRYISVPMLLKVADITAEAFDRDRPRDATQSDIDRFYSGGFVNG